MNNEIQQNQKVRVNGQSGIVETICTGQLTGMVEVRLERGCICVPIAEIQIL